MHCRVFSRILSLPSTGCQKCLSPTLTTKTFSVLVLVPVPQREGEVSHWDEGIKYEFVYISLFDYNIEQ